MANTRIPFRQTKEPQSDKASPTLIDRNFSQLEIDINKLSSGGAATFDALVDSSLAASDTKNRKFKGIGEAINFMVGVMKTFTIVVRGESTAYVESADISQGTANVKLIGAPNITYAANPSGPPFVAWRVRNLTLNSLTLEEVNMAPAINGVTITTNNYFMALRCELGDNVNLVNNNLTISGGSLFAALDCQIDIQNASSSAISAGAIWYKGFLRGTITFTGTDAMDITMNIFGGGTQTFSAPRINANLQQVFGFIGTAGGVLTSTVVFSQATAGVIHANVRGPTPQISNSGGISTVTGTFDQMPTINAGTILFDITLTGNSGAGQTISGGQGIIRMLRQNSALTLTVNGGGPWLIYASLGNYAGASVVTALNVAGVTDSVFVIAAHNTGTNKQGSVFAASTARCKVDFAGRSTFDVASTDSGTGNVFEVT